MVKNGYDLPNVPFVQYFYKGYAIHGAYWHAVWGTPISHGCVNMKIPDAQALYYWTNPILDSKIYSNTSIKPEESTRVVVHGVTPRV
ncbi:L,D-transpeptidase [Candidatus Microgenomates bacterium]|nr:L,D-transpeptidase [Candidatus Microgenomates bacterium]